MNYFRTFIFLAVLTALFLMIGYLLGGQTGLVIALVFAVIMNFSAYWFSDQLVLSLYHAKPVARGDSYGLFQIVERLAAQAQIPMPKVYVIEEPLPNAFATGRDPANASICATTGLLQFLNQEELTGVLAHELTHVINRDTLISAIAATIAGAISALANMAMLSSMFGGQREEDQGSGFAGILMAILGPIAAMCIQMAVSRSREYAADAGGAKLCGNPLWLAQALAKIEQAKHTGYSPIAESHPATSHLFIINPLRAEQLAELFSTHPATAERIARLQKMAQTGQYEF